jgi:hypothetical protein
MTIEAANVRRLAKLVGWPALKQKAFLTAKGDAEWDTAKKSTIDLAVSHLEDTAKMFGIEIEKTEKADQKTKLKLYDPTDS